MCALLNTCSKHCTQDAIGQRRIDGKEGGVRSRSFPELVSKGISQVRQVKKKCTTKTEVYEGEEETNSKR